MKYIYTTLLIILLLICVTGCGKNETNSKIMVDVIKYSGGNIVEQYDNVLFMHYGGDTTAVYIFTNGQKVGISGDWTIKFH
jgi:hypothetical protein